MRGPAFVVSALGVAVGVTFDASEPAETVQAAREAWAGAIVAGEQAAVDKTVAFGGDRGTASAFERLSVDVTLAALEHRRGEMLMFHAAGVATPSGAVAAFVGPSGRGKTTLSRALGPHFGYVSDEAVAVDDDRRVYAYRKPLSVVTGDGPKAQVAPRDAGLSGLPDAPLRLAVLALLDRREDAPTPVLERVSTMDALAELVPQMSYLADLDRPLVRLFTLADELGGVRRLRYAEAVSVVDVVAAAVDERAGASAEREVESSWTAVDVAVLPTSVADAVECDGRMAVLAGRTVHVLSGIAPEIVRHAASVSEIMALAAAVVAVYGPPESGSAEELVAVALQELVDAGIVPAGAQ